MKTMNNKDETILLDGKNYIVKDLSKTAQDIIAEIKGVRYQQQLIAEKGIKLKGVEDYLVDKLTIELNKQKDKIINNNGKE